MSRVRIGVIGAGWFATTNHIPVLAKREDVELAAVCRLGKEPLEKVRQHFGFPFACEDYRELLEQKLDGVIVSSPHNLHYEHASAALERGLHVMCEKPMTLDSTQAWELVRKAKEKQRHLLVPYGWHYKSFVGEARKMMLEGGVGAIEHVLCHMASPAKDFFAGTPQAPADWSPTLSAPEPSTWQDKKRGGGYGHGQITHSSGLMFWVTDLRAESVSSRMTAPNAPVDLYDAAAVVFRDGSIGSVSGAATLPVGDAFQVDLRVFGDRGVLLLDVEAGRERLELRRHDGGHRHVEVPSGEGAYSCEGPPNRFIELIHGRGENESPGEIAARTVELLEAMYRSADEGGRTVEVGR